MPPAIPIERSGRARQRIWRLAWPTAAGATLLAGAVLATARPASAASIINPSSTTAIYTLQNQATGQVADDLNANTGAGNTIGQWPSKGAINQQWTIVSSTGSDAGYYTIQNNNDGMCLDVSGQSTADGAPVIQWPCNGQDNQEWQIEYTGNWDGAAAIAWIVNKNSGKALNVQNDADATGLVQGSYSWNTVDNGTTGWSNQWSITRSTGGIPIVLSALQASYQEELTPAANEVLEDPNSATTWGTPVDLHTPSGDQNQVWYLQAAGHVSWGWLGMATEYRIINGSSNECLEARGSNPGDGAVIDQYGCDPNSVNQPNQLWVVYNIAGVEDDDPFLTTSTTGDVETYPAVSLFNMSQYVAPTDARPEPQVNPTVTESSTASPADGSTMTLQNYGDLADIGLPFTSQIWALTEISTTGKPSGSSGTACNAYDCLVNLSPAFTGT